MSQEKTCHLEVVVMPGLVARYSHKEEGYEFDGQTNSTRVSFCLHAGQGHERIDRVLSHSKMVDERRFYLQQ